MKYGVNVIKSHLFAGNLENDFSKPSFTTSLEVVSEVMNVPLVAVKAIARQAGIPTDDARSMCIDENVLRQQFSSAFVRKTKNYFFNCIRNSALLSPSDLQIFIDFCKSFKKQDVSVDDVTEWSHIDTDKLREEFIAKVKEKTPKQPTLLDLFSGLGNFEICEYEEVSLCSFDQFSISFDTTYNNVAEQTDDSFSFTKTWCYKAKYKEPERIGIANIVINQIYIPAHYYIYIDDDDHPTVNTLFSSINSALRMAS